MLACAPKQISFATDPDLARPSPPVSLTPSRGSRMTFPKFAFLIAALVALTAAGHVQQAVQPGGDIPANFKGAVPPIPPGGDIPRAFNAPRGPFQYVRREAMIPMRDGA